MPNAKDKTIRMRADFPKCPDSTRPCTCQKNRAKDRPRPPTFFRFMIESHILSMGLLILFGGVTIALFNFCVLYEAPQNISHDDDDTRTNASFHPAPPTGYHLKFEEPFSMSTTNCLDFIRVDEDGHVEIAEIAQLQQQIAKLRSELTEYQRTQCIQDLLQSKAKNIEHIEKHGTPEDVKMIMDDFHAMFAHNCAQRFP